MRSNSVLYFFLEKQQKLTLEYQRNSKYIASWRIDECNGVPQNKQQQFGVNQ